MPILNYFLASSTDPCDNAPANGERINEIIHDSVEYEFYEETFRYTDREYVYSLLHDDSVLRSSNADYLEFYEHEREGTLGVVRMIEELLDFGLYDSALTYLTENMSIDSLIEKNIYYTLKVQLDCLIEERDLNDVEEDSLYALAYSTPLEGGPGVFNARSMLKLEINDPGSALRNFHPSLNTYNGKNISIFPNPSTGVFNIVNAGKSMIKVYDSSGRLLYTGQNINEINMVKFENGIYLLNIHSENGELKHCKAILNK